MASIERTRAKHNELVAQLAKVNDKREKILDSLDRIGEKRAKLIRAIARSSKRLDKLAIVTHNGGPTATPLPKVITAIDAKPARELPNDPVDLGKLTPQQADKVIAAKPLPVYDFEKPRKRNRRTPDDFAAELKKKKAAPSGAA